MVPAPGVISDWTRIQLPSGPWFFAVTTTVAPLGAAVTAQRVWLLMLLLTLVAIAVAASPLVIVVSMNSAPHQKRKLPLLVASLAMVMVRMACAPDDSAT